MECFYEVYKLKDELTLSQLFVSQSSGEEQEELVGFAPHRIMGTVKVITRDLRTVTASFTTFELSNPQIIPDVPAFRLRSGSRADRIPF